MIFLQTRKSECNVFCRKIELGLKSGPVQGYFDQTLLDKRLENRI